MTASAAAASASGTKDGAVSGDNKNNGNADADAANSARPPLLRRSSGSTGSTPGGGGSPNMEPTSSGNRPPQPQAPQHRSTPSASADLPPLHPAATSTGVLLTRQISDASAQQQRAAGVGNYHRSNQPSLDTAAGNETLGNETLDSAYIATALAESTSAIRQTHGIAFHDDDSSMGSVVFHYGLGSTPPNGDYDLAPPQNIAGNRGRAGTAGTVDSGLTADGGLDRSNHRLHAVNANITSNGTSSTTTAKELHEHSQMPFRQYLPMTMAGNQQQTKQPQEEQHHQKRWGSEMGINQTPSADYVARGKSSSLTSSGNGSEGVVVNDGDEADINDGRVLPYNVRLSQRGGGPQVPPPPPPPPPPANMSPMRKPPLSPAKTRGAVTIPQTPPSDFSSLSASTYTTLGTRSGNALRGVEYAELPGDRSPATMTSGVDVPPIPGLGVDGRSDVPTSHIPKMKHPRSPLSRKKRDGASAGNHNWFNKLAHKMRGGSKSNTKGSFGSIDDPKLAKEAKRYHDKNQAFLKRTEWHRKMQRSGNMEQAAVMAAGSNHSRTRTDLSGALDSIASISSEEITDDDDERRKEKRHEARPLIAESKEEEYLRRIRELEDENRRLLRVQAMEAEVHGYSAGYGTLPTAVPITVDVDRAIDDGARKARVARGTNSLFGIVWKRTMRFLTLAEQFFANLPLTICAMAMSWVTLGVVVFKLYEEVSDSCVPKHFHSLACTFPEFPGCFECRDDSEWYRIAVGFHYTASTISALMIVCVLIKFIIAGRVILDDLENPTSSAPYGLLFMASACVFAGRGLFGKVVVICTGGLHFLLTLWFMYSVRAYKSLPDPSFFPNTIGIGYPAVKLWLYYPYPGLFLMTVSLVSFILLFPTSLFRVWTVQKISAPVCWIQISGPSIVLYTLTLLAQPSSFTVESNLDPDKYLLMHRKFYLPCMHVMFVLCVVGVISSVVGLCQRWNMIVNKPFTPAHAAFVFPCLSHANAIQAYRGAVDAFSTITPGSPFKVALFCYWMLFLVIGTIVCFVFSIKFFRKLPQWTQIQVEGPDKEPPAPNETNISDVVSIGERWRHQNYVSPAILQANETGGIVRRRRGTQDGRGAFVRTRKLTAVGFDPTMSLAELENEIEILLAEVERNPPRQRRGWHSVIPGIDFGSDLASLGSGGRVHVFDGLFDAMSFGSNGGGRNLRRSRAQSEDVRLSAAQSQYRRGHDRQDTNDSDLMRAWG